MASAAETLQSIQKALEPYVRPREEAEQIRRVLALNLRSCYENGPQHGPLGLAEPDCTIKTTDVRGLQRDYLKALHANIKAHREYESISQQRIGKETKDVKSRDPDEAGRLQDQIEAIKLQRKQERLQTIEKYLGQLGQKPAASPEFLQPDEIFQGSKSLPEVPKTVVSSFTVDNSSTKTDLKALVDRLEKAVLRSKLLLRKEEQLLEQVKARSTISPENTSGDAKLAALNATRNELISWMETELGKASAVEEPNPEEAGKSAAKVDKAHLDEQLALIKQKYADYVAARKSLVQLVAQSPPPSIKLAQEGKGAEQSEAPPPPSPPPTTHLITPYIENLLSISHEQKASITQKSHFSNVLTKQTEGIGKALARLAEESQLLPEHPNSRGQEHSGVESLDKRGHEITKRVQPWVNAADAAKLATLEAVAEKIEEGQVALEGSTTHLAEIDQLLGRNAGVAEESGDEDASMDDIWLAETRSPRKGAKAPARSSDKPKGPKDVWSLLDGNLGLINAEDSPRR